MTRSNQKAGLIVLCTAAFIVPFMGSALNLAFPQISTEFSMKAVSMTWLSTAYLISTAIFQIPFARLADIVGRKKIFMTGVGIFVISSICCGFVNSGASLIIMRLLTGTGCAMMFGTNIAILSSIFPPEQRGKAIGINTSVVYAALAAGPLLGGLMTEHLGWRSIFFISAGIGVIVLILTRLFLKGEWIEAKGEKFDLRGAILYGSALASIIYGFSALPSWWGFSTLVFGIIDMIFFIRYEMRAASPVFNVRLFSGNRVFTLSSLAALINYSATFAITFMLSLYLQYVLGLRAIHAGFILISQACIQSLFSLLSGNMSRETDPSVLATTGMILSVVGLIGLLFISPTTPIWYIISILLLLGVGFGIFSSPNVTVIMGSVDKKDYSQASATTGTMRLTGQSISMGIAGMTIALTIGNNTIVPELYPQFIQSMKITFSIFIILCLIGVYASSARIKKSGI